MPIVGLYFDLDSKNANASVMTVSYWKNTSAWATTSATDGTASGGATMAQDGLVYWTQPSDELWAAAITGKQPGYWYRISISADLDAAVTVLQMMALSRRSASQRPTVTRSGSYIHSFTLNAAQTVGFQLDVASVAGTLTLHWIKH